MIIQLIKYLPSLIRKLLERLLRQRELFDDDKLKLIKEQLKIAKNELAMIEEKTSKGFK